MLYWVTPVEQQWSENRAKATLSYLVPLRVNGCVLERLGLSKEPFGKLRTHTLNDSNPELWHSPWCLTDVSKVTQHFLNRCFWLALTGSSTSEVSCIIASTAAVSPQTVQEQNDALFFTYTLAITKEHFWVSLIHKGYSQIISMVVKRVSCPHWSVAT